MKKDITAQDLDNLKDICLKEGLQVLDLDVVWSSAFVRLEDYSIPLDILNNLNESAQNHGFKFYGVIANKTKPDRLDLHFSRLEL